MDSQTSLHGSARKLRVTPERRQAMVGLWELNGQRVLMLADPDSGALMARDTRGRRVNPMRLITRGMKLEKGNREAS